MNRISLVLRRRARGDNGVALLVVIGLMAVVGVLMLVMVGAAIREGNATGRDRQRSSAVMTAEGQVDSIISKIQSAPLAGLPCGASTVTGVPVGSDKMTITNTVTYYTAAGALVDCSVLATTPVAQAKIKSTSSSNRIAGQASATRTVETLLNLKPSYANALNNAIFSNASMTLSNNTKIFGQGSSQDADIYSNGSVTCDNAVEFHGSIYSQGTVTMSSTCVVSVDVQAKLGYYGNNPNAGVTGKILVSNGDIVLNKSNVGQQARARGTVTGDVCATAGKCFGGDKTLAPPPYQAFPPYNWDSATQAAWTSDGYTLVTLPTDQCGMYDGPGPLKDKVDGVAHWIYDNMATMGNTVLYANCPGNPVTFQGVNNISLNANLAIYATGGFNFSGNTQIASNSSTHRLLYLVQPWDSVTTHPCTTDGISLDNQVTVADTIDDLLYSPCNIRKANNTTHYGQIYAGGSVSIDNKMTMYYKPLPVPGPPSGGSVDNYTVDILYMRETTP